MGLNLPRIFAAAFARRLALVVVGVVFAFVASCFSDAHAQSCPAPAVSEPPGGTFTYEGQARAACEADGAARSGKSIGGYIRTFVGCRPNSGNSGWGTWFAIGKRNSDCSDPANPGAENRLGEFYFFNVGGCPAGETWDDALKKCSQCVAGEETVTTPGNLGAYRCRAGSCPVAGSMCSGTQPGAPSGYVCWVGVGGSKCDADDEDFCPSGTIKSPLNGICYPEKECPVGTIKDSTGECIPPLNCPEGQSKDQFGNCKPNDSECPAGQLKSPEGNCLPGEGQCSAGEVRGSDGTCKKDSDGDGQADEGEDSGTFSGGESCDVPPQCSGDNIMCGQAVIQWRIDCNTRRQANISGGTCDAMPVCAGEKCDPLDYAQLIVSWRATCALEAMAQESGPGGSGDGDGPETWDAGGFGEAVAEAAAGATGPHCTGDDCPGGEGPGGTGELDSSGLGWGRACPALPTVAVMGATIDFNAVAGGDMCDWIALGGQIVLILAALASLRILAGGMA